MSYAPYGHADNVTLGFRQPFDSRTEEAGREYQPFNHNRLRRFANRETDQMHKALEPTQDSRWILSHEGYNVLSDSAVESRLAFGNGFLGILRETADADLDFDPNNAGGVRIAGLGALWQAVMLGFAGLDLRVDTLGIDPRLPPQ